MPQPIIPDVAGLLDRGLKCIDDELQREFDGGCAVPALIGQLTSLRNQYVFDKMRIVRAGIAVDDASPGQTAVAGALAGACEELDRLQAGAASEDGWIDRASDALAKVASLASQLAKA